jgi:hypothetical protein
MKTFIIAFLFIAAAVFPILFFPLLALTLIIIMAVSPYVATHGLGMWSNEDELKKSLNH